MGIATGPPIRHDLSFRANDDKPITALWLRADAITPIGVTDATLTMRFDLPNDDLWELDPDTGLPVPPDPHTHVITGGAPGDPGGWVVTDRFADGEILVVVPHTVWTDVAEPWTGVWDLVATSVDSLQRCLMRGEFVNEKGAVP